MLALFTEVIQYPPVNPVLEVLVILAFVIPFAALLGDVITHVIKFFTGPLPKKREIIVNAASLAIAVALVLFGGLTLVYWLLISGLIAAIIVHVVLGEDWRPPWVKRGRSEGSALT